SRQSGAPTGNPGRGFPCRGGRYAPDLQGNPLAFIMRGSLNRSLRQGVLDPPSTERDSPSESTACKPARAGWKDRPCGTRGSRGTGRRRPTSHRFRKDTPMPKIKTNRAAAKRFRKTASGKYK